MEEDSHYSVRLRYGVRQALGLGALAGALEMVALSASLALPLGFVWFALLGLVAMACAAALAAVLALAVGWPLLRATRRRLSSRAVSLQLGLVGFGLAGFYLWRGAWGLLADEAPGAAAAMALMPFGFLGVVAVNARFWLRRMEVGQPAAVGWLPVAVAGGVVLVLGAAGMHASGVSRVDYTLEGDESVLLVTIDGLGRDEVFGPRVDMAHVASVADGGVAFLDAVTPAPASLPANAAVLTGLHPLRNRVIANGEHLSSSMPSLTEALAREGYVTAAFVSSRHVAASTGMSQGFHTYDDDFSPVLPGLDRVALPGLLVSGWLALTDGGGTSVWQGRDDADTVARFVSWLEARGDQTAFAWVHLAAASRGQRTASDAAVGEILGALAETGRDEDTIVVVAGTHGRAGTGSLREAAVRVPLVLRVPGLGVTMPEVSAQVRLIDVPATVLDALEMDPLGASEGVSLVEYAIGDRRASIWTSLVARGPDGQVAFGMRNNGVKYVRDPDGTERMYNIVDDPEEHDDLAPTQPGAMDQARSLLSADRAALTRLVGD